MKTEMKRFSFLIVAFLLFQFFIHFPLFNNHQINYLMAQNPLLQFTEIPQWGTSRSLKGKVYNVDPEKYKIAVYIFIEGNGWWTKPSFATPFTSINSDSTWICNIVTGGNDIYATQICAYLLPDTVIAPRAENLSDLPLLLDTIALTKTCEARCGKPFKFSGYDWCTKASVYPVGPGSNYFSESQDNVWLDSLSRLHLRITHRDGKWLCPEVINGNNLGYGTYSFQIIGKIGDLDPNVVLGLFTWDNSSVYNHREIDIEFSKWGLQNDTNTQYVIQPYDSIGNRYQWIFPGGIDSSTHSFSWCKDKINFLSKLGFDLPPSSDSVIHTWAYDNSSSIPDKGNENIRINLWLLDGQPPIDTNEVEVIINQFSFNGIDEINEDEFLVHNSSNIIKNQNYPNPFSFKTNIRLTLNKNSKLNLSIYNIYGEKIISLYEGYISSGNHSFIWNSLDKYGVPVQSGVYFYVIKSDSETKTGRMNLIR
ncbi:MAG: T9SS type A sorting domain-containing protein [Bacteroidota bacterium]